MREGTEERLARRYWDLLDFYPTWFRAERGEELVGTLLDCARPGQTRPARREARALMLEGLRMRAGTSRHRSARATLADGVRLGVLLLLVGMTVRGVTALGTSRGYDDVRPATAGWWPLVGLAVLAGAVPVVLLARGRVRPALPFVVVAGAVQLLGFPWLHRTGGPTPVPPDVDWPSLLPIHLHPGPATAAVLATAALIWLRPRPAGTPAVALAVAAPVLVWTPDWLEAADLLPNDHEVTLPLHWLVVLGYFAVIGYAVVDARPVVAVAFLLSALLVEVVASFLKFGVDGFSAVVIVALVLPVGVAAWIGVRRQARLPGPDIAA